MERPNELRDGVADLAGKDFIPSHVCDNPLIYLGRAVKRTKDTPARAIRNKDHALAPPSEVMEQKGNLCIRDLWHQGTDSVHDMRVVKTDTQLHRMKDPERCLQEAERGKNGMYL